MRYPSLTDHLVIYSAVVCFDPDQTGFVGPLAKIEGALSDYLLGGGLHQVESRMVVARRSAGFDLVLLDGRLDSQNLLYSIQLLVVGGQIHPTAWLEAADVGAVVDPLGLEDMDLEDLVSRLIEAGSSQLLSEVSAKAKEARTIAAKKVYLSSSRCRAAEVFPVVSETAGGY